MITAIDWLIEQLTPSISLQQKHIDNLKAEAKEKEKGQIIDAIVCYFQVNDKTPYGMEYLSKLDNAISDGEEFYNKTYTGEKVKSFIDGTQKWNYFTDNNYPLNDWDIVVFSNKKNKYFIEYTDSEFHQRCINRNYIKWMKL